MATRSRVRTAANLVLLLMITSATLSACSGQSGTRPSKPEPTGAGTAKPKPASSGVTVTWYGQSMFSLKTPDISVVTDPFSRELGYPIPGVTADVVTVSHEHFDHNAIGTVRGNKAVVRGAKTITAAKTTFTGIASYHDNVKGTRRGANTVFRFQIGGIQFAHMGDFGEDALSKAQLDALAGTEVLFIPVGGGYTIGPDQAAKIVEKVDPNVVIPMHYGTSQVRFGLKPVDEFARLFLADKVKELPASVTINADELPGSTEVWVLQYGK